MWACSLHLPPLRDRREDIPALADAFLQKISDERKEPVKQLSTDALDAINVYDWPGNVRELENALEHAAILTRDEEIAISSFPERITPPNTHPPPPPRPPHNPTPPPPAPP